MRVNNLRYLSKYLLFKDKFKQWYQICVYYKIKVFIKQFIFET